MEIVKKVIFQGKPWDEANIEHLKIELGDVMWYVAQACMALDISLEEVLDRNIEKLSSVIPLAPLMLTTLRIVRQEIYEGS